MHAPAPCRCGGVALRSAAQLRVATLQTRGLAAVAAVVDHRFCGGLDVTELRR